MYYNPVRAALSAAAAELSSPAARRFYATRAQQDIQGTLIFIVQFGCIAYALGQTCRQWVASSAASSPSSAASSAAICIPNFLTPVPRRREAGQVPGDLIPVRVVAIASITPAALAGYSPIALLSPAPKAKRTRKPAAAQALAKPTAAPTKGKGVRSRKATATA